MCDTFQKQCATLKTEYEKQLKKHTDKIPDELLKLLYTPNYGRIEITSIRHFEQLIDGYKNSMLYIHPHKNTYPVVVFVAVITHDKRRGPTYQDIVIDNYGNMYTLQQQIPDWRTWCVTTINPFQTEFMLPDQLIDLLKKTFVATYCESEITQIFPNRSGSNH